MKKPEFNLSFKPLIGLLAMIGILILAANFLIGRAKRLDFFLIKDIIIRQPAQVKADLSYLKGRNIFFIDLDKEQAYLSEKYPFCQKIRLVRVFPDRLFVDFLARKPVAYLKLYRDFCVDEKGAIFLPAQGAQYPELPVVTGLQRKSGIGLAAALEIIKAAQASKITKDARIKRIDAASPANIIVFMANNTLFPEAISIVQVKITPGFISDKINILASLINQEKDFWANVNYIDLRFKEPVIKYKKVK